MTAAWFVGARNPVPQDATLSRQTTSEIEDDSPAELSTAPGWNENAADPHAHAGLDTHYVGGAVTEKRSVPSVFLANVDYNQVVDDQVASSGRAASIAAQGVWGHGTMQYTESMQPVIRDGGALGNTLFVTLDQPVQMGAGNSMMPDQIDQSWSAVAQAQATKRARLAFAGSVVNADGWGDVL